MLNLDFFVKMVDILQPYLYNKDILKAGSEVSGQR